MNESTKEVAKATNKALEVTEKVGGFFTTVLGDACKEIGSSVHDWAKLYRYKNLLKISDKVHEIHKKRKLEGKSIPVQPSVGIPMLEAASTVEDEYLQQKWAALISNATDPNNKTKIRKSYVEILSSLDPTDAVVLEWLQKNKSDDLVNEITTKVISDNSNFTFPDTKISVINLHRLGLIDVQVPTTVGRMDMNASSERASFKINPLGDTLLNLCKANA